MKSFANALIDALQRIADASLNASRKGWGNDHHAYNSRPDDPPSDKNTVIIWTTNGFQPGGKHIGMAYAGAIRTRATLSTKTLPDGRATVCTRPRETMTRLLAFSPLVFSFSLLRPVAPKDAGTAGYARAGTTDQRANRRGLSRAERWRCADGRGS